MDSFLSTVNSDAHLSHQVGHGRKGAGCRFWQSHLVSRGLFNNIDRGNRNLGNWKIGGKNLGGRNFGGGN